MTAAVSRDTRDDIMNPVRGMFLSLSLEYAAPVLGSDLNPTRSFSQMFFLKRIGCDTNVYESLGEFNPLSTREAAGIALRWNSPFAMLRLD